MAKLLLISISDLILLVALLSLTILVLLFVQIAAQLHLTLLGLALLPLRILMLLEKLELVESSPLVYLIVEAADLAYVILVLILQLNDTEILPHPLAQ